VAVLHRLPVRTVITIVAVTGCRPGVPPHRAPETSVPSTPAPTTPEPEPIPPAFSAVPVPPSTILVGTPATRFSPSGSSLDGLALAVGTVVPAFGSEPSVLFVTHRTSPERPGDIYLFPGDLPPGTLAWEDHVAGSLDEGVLYEEHFGPVADLDEDGHLDVWLYDRLLRGPFLGRDIVYADERTVTVDEAVFAGGLAGFDADQDGHGDLLLDSLGWGVLFYGPFSGSMSAYDPGVSWIGQCTYDNPPWYALLPDLLGPGQDAIAKGGNACNAQTFLYPSDIPRGTVLTEDQAFAENRGSASGQASPVEPLGDLDDDGVQDVVSGTSNGSVAYLGPITGSIEALPEAITWSWTETAVVIERQVGDVNGDGLPDVLARVHGEPELMEIPLWDWFVLLLSPLGPEIDPWTDGIPIDRYENHDHLGLHHGDLDGDGLSDLLSSEVGTDGAGHISIWYARDLLTHAPSEAP
jgi:hypothetical protein